MTNLLASGGGGTGLKLVPGCTLAVWNVSSEPFGGAFFRSETYHMRPRAMAVSTMKTVATPTEGFERGRVTVSVVRRPSSSKFAVISLSAPDVQDYRVFAGACSV